jgi:hypothetical protein
MFLKTNTEYPKFEEIYDVKQKSIKLINKQRLQGGGGGMYVIRGSHFVPLEGKFLLKALLHGKASIMILVS